MKFDTYFLYIAILFTIISNAQEFSATNGVSDASCTGVLYDTGGPDDFIGNNTDVTYTICPDEGQDLRLALDFIEFNIPDLPGTSFIIYDGEDTNANVLFEANSDDFPNAPGFIQASDPNLSGCLTFRILTGSIFSFEPNFEANISCEEPCQLIESDIVDVTPAEFENDTAIVFFNEEITFVGAGVFGNNNSDGATYFWDFGDGNTATGQTVTHNYIGLGTFEVSLTITDADGCVSFNDDVQEVLVDIDFDATTGCPNLEVPDVSINEEGDVVFGCDINEPLEITANFFDTGDTSQYVVDQIPYQPPFPFFGGDFIDVTADDDWSPLIPLGFDFVFFEETYQNAIVTDNGAVSFHIQGITPNGTYQPNTNSGYSYNQPIPFNPGSSGPPYLAAIFGVMQDLNPSQSPSGTPPAGHSLNYQVIGEAPCRTLVFNMYNMGHFSCSTNNGEQTSQIVVYETTNTIDVYVEQRTVCPFNSGSGTIGIQNDDGTQGYAPPGRNTGQWTANNEAWRFTPSGPSIVTVKWFDEDDNEIAEGPTLNTTPLDLGFDPVDFEGQTKTLTARAFYDVFGTGEDMVEVEDDVLVAFQPQFDIAEGTSGSACEVDGLELVSTEIDLLNPNLEPEDFNFQWFFEGDAIEGETEQSFTAFESGEYTLEVSSDQCLKTATFDVDIIPLPEVQDIDDLSDSTQDLADYTLDIPNYVSGFLDASTANTSISYHLTESDAENNSLSTITDSENFSPSNETQDIFVRVENEDFPSCFRIEVFTINLVVFDITQPNNLVECTIEENEFGVFDLTQNETQILGSEDSNDFTVTYYMSEQDAQNQDNQIQNPTEFFPTEDNQTIWSNLTFNDQTLFFQTITFELISIRTPILNPNQITLLECGDFTFSQTFNLNLASDDIYDTNSQFDYDLTFYSDAQTNNLITNQNSYPISQNSTTVYYKLTSVENDECFAVGEINLELVNIEIAETPINLEECEDGSGNDTALFDLTQNNPIILGQNQSPTEYSITYFTSFADANGNVNAIEDPTEFQNSASPQPIWVSLANNNFGDDCIEIATFSVAVTEAAEVNLVLDPLEACDNNNNGFFEGFDLSSRISDVNFLNDPDVQVSFHPTPSDAQTGQNPLTTPYANVVESEQVLYVRVLDGGNGCVLTTTLDLFVYDSPLLEEIDPIVVCDTNETGLRFFDLTQVEADLFVEGQNTEDFEISYHLSENAANNDSGIIGTPTAYQNQTSPQTVYVRVSDPTSPLNCFNIAPIELIVDPLPAITPPTLIAECDDADSGSATDETSTFDLTQKIEEISNSNDALEVVFYESELDQQNNNPITNIEAYQNIANPQTIEVSVFSDDTNCAALTTLTLVVDPLPTIPTPEPLVVCDADNEGTSEFDLQAAIETILDGEVNTEITYHFTEVDANNGDNPIAFEDGDNNPILFQNTNPFNQTLYIRAENIGNADINGTGCFTVRALDLEVEESPRIQNLDNLVICDDDSLNGFAAFNLAENTANAIGDQNATNPNLVVTYHETQAQAEAGTDAIAVPSNYTNTTNPQTIYVRLTDEETGCIDQFGFTDDNSFTISVEPYPDLSTPTPLEVCNTQANPEANFPTGNFDLTQKEEELTNLSPVPGNISFSYYQSETDLLNQENQIEDPTDYINSAAPPMLIYVEATNTNAENQCSTTSTITLNVLPLPFPVDLTQEEQRLTACDDDNDGVAAEAFDLTQIGEQITGSENNVGSYYLNEDAAIEEDATAQIANPESYTNDPSLNELDEEFFPTNTQIVWLRLDSNAVGNFCSTITPIEIIVEPNPELNPLGQPFGYTLCEGNPTELPSAEEIAFSLYDVTNGSPSEIIPILDPANENQDQANYEYSFHLSEAEAEAGTNPLGEGYQAANGQILYLRATHIVTGCYNIDNIAEVEITIEPRPEITDQEITPIVVCADEVENNDPENPGNTQADNQAVATVDLTQKEEAVNPNFNNPDSNTIVEYYANQEDFNNGIIIEDPANFTTSETPTTIICEVVDLDNFCSSAEQQSFEIQVNPIPLVDISDMDGAIVCIDPQTGDVIETDFSPPILDTELSEEDYSFAWSLNGNPIAFTGSAYAVEGPGIYTVTVTDLTNNLTNCQASSTAEIIQSNGPDFQVNVLSQAFDGSHSLEVTNIEGDGNYEFSIDNGPWRSLSEGEISILFTGLDAGVRNVRGRDVGGCGEVVVPVSLIDYPKFFTPNADGYNDSWNIIGLANQSNAKIYIFDRYGKLLKQLSPSSPGWDGTYNGEVMPGNDYWFSVEYEEPSTGAQQEFKANFTLKR